MSAFFSVLIPAYNRAEFLPESVGSVFAQTLTNFEVVVVDDGSSDDTPAVLAALQAQHGERLRVLSQEHRGPGAARNLGLAAAQGEYVVFLDSDDLFPEWTLQVLEEAIAAHGRPAVLMSAPHRFSGEAPALEPSPLDARPHPDYLASARSYYPVTVAAAVRAEVLRAHGGFLEHPFCAEDQDLFLRLGVEQAFVFIRAPTLYAYRQHHVSMSREMDALYRGVRFLLQRERSGVYPGGRARYGERAVILARNCRFAAQRCFDAGDRHRGGALFAQGAPHMLAAGHWRDLYRLPRRALKSARRRI